MSPARLGSSARLLLLLQILCVLGVSAPLRAQTQATLAGWVADPSGARVPQAGVRAQAHGSAPQDAVTDAAGNFLLHLAAGMYDVTITAPGFRTYSASVNLTGDGATRLNATLAIDARLDEVTVPIVSEGSLAAADNASALVFRADDLKAFSDDDATFQREIESLAAGPGGRAPNIYVNGFSGGKFPPKSSIREVRINSNPYSAEFQDLGIGRFEVFTKPGTEKLHGTVSLNATDDVLNTQNPYLTTAAAPPYYQLTFDGNLNGPINRKTGFFLAANVTQQQNNVPVNAVIVDPVSLQQVPFSQAVRDPQLSNTYSLRIDRQITPLNTLTGRYEFSQVTQTNGGLTALLTLPSQAFNLGTNTQTLQLSDTQVIGQHAVADTRFQYSRTRLTQGAVSTAPTLLVQGGFNGGGAPSQQYRDDQDRYEFQEYANRQVGKHFLRFGGRYRLQRDSNFSTQNYNGQYTFPTLAAYQQTLQGTAQGATQYSVTTGSPSAVVLSGDLGVYVDDEWKVTPHLSLDLGMRYETQSAIPDHNDPAPRVGFNWGLYRKAQKVPFVIVRGGGGVFYDRFSPANILTAVRQNGVSQQTFLLTNPTYNPNGAPAGGALAATPPTVYRISPNLRSAYGWVGGLSVEKNNKLGHFSANYIFIRGSHQWGSRNINAPLPGTYDPANPASGVRPQGGTQNIYQFESEGIQKTQLGFINANVHVGKRGVVFINYSVTHSDQDVSSAGTFASNSYNYRQDYGRASQPTQQLFTGGSVQVGYGFLLNVFASTQGGVPFNITTGTDLNGDTIYNDRPAFATAPTSKSVLYSTRYGLLDANPQPGEKIVPINYGNSPNFTFIDLSLARNFKVGPRPAAAATAPGAKPAPKPDRPYTLGFMVDAGNVLNHRNPAPPVGVLSSPFFGQSLTLNNVFGQNNTASNRVVFLQTSFSF